MSKLFLIEFPSTQTQEELEKVQGLYSQYSKEYVASGSIKERRSWIESMWNMCEEYVENNFQKELATVGRFTQKTWELVICTFLIKSGLNILRRNGEGPDFLIEIANKKIWIEATAPSIGNVDPAPQRPELKSGEIYTDGGNIEIIYRQKILRFISAIRNKSNRADTSQYFKSKKSGLINENDCYVIAVNGYEFSGIVTDPMFLLRRSLFAAGCLSYRRLSDGSLSKGEYLYEPVVIKIKPDGTQENIPTDIFTNDAYSEISAVIYSPEHIINTVGDLDRLGRTIFLIRNPFAKNPLPDVFLKIAHELIFRNNVISEIEHDI